MKKGQGRVGQQLTRPNSRKFGQIRDWGQLNQIWSGQLDRIRLEPTRPNSVETNLTEFGRDQLDRIQSRPT